MASYSITDKLVTNVKSLEYNKETKWIRISQLVLSLEQANCNTPA